MIRAALVEDDPIMVERLRAAIALAEDVSLVAVAGSFQSGRAMIAHGGFDVLLCDLGLPGGSGVDLIREAAQLYPNIDIMVVTVFGDQGKVLESIKAGAQGYLLKDAQLDSCVESIRHLHAGGSPISPVIARQLLRQLSPPEESASVLSDAALSPREIEVLNLLARGFSYAEVASFLALSSMTIGTYVKRIYRKLEVRSRSEAVFEASSRGIIKVH